jgi:hypothetical protein
MRSQTLFVSMSKLARVDGSVEVVRVAMVCNDLAVANSCMGYYKEMKSKSLNHVRRGGLLYFARMSCGHLYEGMKAIKAIRDHSDLRSLVSRCSTRAQVAFEELCELLPGGTEYKSFDTYVGWIRNRVAFHYDANDLRWAMERRAKQSTGYTSTATAGEDIRSTRLEFADDLLDTIVCRKFWNIPESADVQAEAERIAGWCAEKCIRFLEFGEDFVPRFLRAHAIFR